MRAGFAQLLLHAMSCLRDRELHLYSAEPPPPPLEAQPSERVLLCEPVLASSSLRSPSEDSEGDTESEDELVAPDAAPPRHPAAPGRQQLTAAAALQPPATLLHAQRQPPAAPAPPPAPSAPPPPAPPAPPARA